MVPAFLLDKFGYISFSLFAINNPKGDVYGFLLDKFGYISFSFLL